MRATRLLPFATALALTAAAAPAVAQQQGGAQPTPQQLEEAREQYRQGVNAFRQRHFGDAVVFFERSYRLRPHPATLYNAAEARLRAGDRDRALEQLRELLAMTDPAPDQATIDRARTLAREAGVENLEPAPRQTTECPTCPVCPQAGPCPECPPPRVVEPNRGPLPWVLAGTGTVLFGAGMYFYSVALADSAVYNRVPQEGSAAFRESIRNEGETYRWIGLTGIILGLGLDAAAVYLLVRPQPAPRNAAAAAAPQGVTARVGVGPGSLVLSGTF